MTEQQRYEVVAQLPGFELRRYEPHVLAEVTVSGRFESAAVIGVLIALISLALTMVAYRFGMGRGAAAK